MRPMRPHPLEAPCCCSSVSLKGLGSKPPPVEPTKARGCAYCNVHMELYVVVCVTLSVCTPAAYRLCVVCADARRLHGGARRTRGTRMRLRRFADQYVTYEHGAPPSCALSVHTSESTASAAQLALPPATAAHGLTATLAWHRVARVECIRTEDVANRL